MISRSLERFLATFKGDIHQGESLLFIFSGRQDEKSLPVGVMQRLQSGELASSLVSYPDIV